MDQAWFEMADVRRRKFDSTVWIPLRASHQLAVEGQAGCDGFKEEYFGIGHIIVPMDSKEQFEDLGWSDVGPRHSHTGWFDEATYVPVNFFSGGPDTAPAEYLVLAQHYNAEERNEWHLSQDLVLTLGLKREGDVWVRPEEGYLEVARLLRGPVGDPVALEVRAMHLRDYLCARGMALYLTSYRSRTEIVETADHIGWPDGSLKETAGMDEWEGRVVAIHEGGMGMRFGEEMAVFHASRTDVDPEDDVPRMGVPSDANTKSDTWTRRFAGRKLFRLMGELWRKEWVAPAASSPIIRSDEVSPTVFFITDVQGTQESRETLVDGDGRWLWFKSDVIPALAHKRGGNLSWYSRDTGAVGCSPDYGVHFGMNSLGLINVFAKDIGLLPDWQQKVWSGYNVSPDGKVSNELLMSQVEARPADTQAPEQYLPLGLKRLADCSEAAYGKPFIRPHERATEIIRQIHRFRSTDQNGLFALAKDVARVTADSLDASAMHGVVPPPAKEKWGSLKSLENVLAAKIGQTPAHEVMGPLFAVYELRLSDAHLPSGSNLDETLALLGIQAGQPIVIQGYRLLGACVSCIYRICNIIEQPSQLPLLQ